MYMKKLFAMLLALMLLAGFAGCGASGGEEDVETTASDEFAALLDGRKPPGKLTDDEKNKLAAEGKALGLNLDFDAGGLTITDGKGDVIFRQENDGTLWDEFGRELIAGSDWPDNEFTRQIPNPGLETCAGTSSSEGIEVMLDEMDEAAARAYVESLKDAGFTNELPGMGLKSKNLIEFKAKNAKGYIVEFLWANGGANLTVNK